MKARADRTKKLADYDRRLQECKENVSVWMSQVRSVVDVRGFLLFFFGC
jgi:hypothetical protein